jgi:nicotinate-nucleotide adenylyltransferase
MNKNIENNKADIQLCIYGGSFNPPSVGHQQVFNYLKNVLNIPKILVVPCSARPGKDGDTMEFLKHRIKMCEIAFGSKNIWRHGTQFIRTIDLVHAAQKEFGTQKIHVVIGSDNLVDIETWFNYKELCNSVRFIIVERKGSVNSGKSEPYLKNVKDYIWIDNLDRFDNVSSSLIRKTIPTMDLKNTLQYLDKNVYEYICDHWLYDSEFLNCPFCGSHMIEKSRYSDSVICECLRPSNAWIPLKIWRGET